MLERIRIVLVNTSHPGNIGAAARAMKTMGLSDLWLVAPAAFPDPEASALASGAEDVLSGAQVVATLDQAVADAVWVVGTSARLRAIRWPLLEPRACAARALAEAGQGTVALVFGRERSGLTNEELDLCHALVNIPANPDYASLNLAQAVQVLSYELRTQWLGSAVQAQQTPEHPPATAREMEGLFAHLEQTLYELEFISPEQPGQMMRRLRRLFTRARPDRNEVNILRGILSAAQAKALDKTGTGS
ncbi:tRNA (cytidine/uridine-2'-O-)-methyltransferase TrmJ [Thiohalobacter sp. COW1]|uniref:tRNA (cytidine/uridine-2'-O-)-methyltransferase TrmJ n=1 Tax=Thiohalobacter thiocyanaticus TaxID=585455 RepID=A0A1Z4VQY9_9GAMM|nr:MULTISPECIES: tRNA (cytosine(32)/uridine(32)-2'-O)-methyltransferase TrmJ [Thiohalobacter]BAZ93624.1 tRNA/rRNA methyltransferase [Thiohalobacter thiocyanaticus]BCO31333.1 tRNA (cytidine/uridine-2'-O-)-methyltransferase TrmJ [Thiohalobacter sp. COW1]